MKIVIFGGTGFLGSNLQKFFLTNSDNVVHVISRNPPQKNTKNVIHHSFKTAKDNIDNICQDAELVFYLISLIMPREDADLQKIINFETENLSLIMSSMNKVKHKSKFIYVSSGGAVYGELYNEPFSEKSIIKPITNYGNLKVAGENFINSFCLNENISKLILRPSNIYGRIDNLENRSQGVISIFISQIKKYGYVKIFGKGESVKDYIYINDFIFIISKLIEKNSSGTFNIGSGQLTTVNEIVKVLEDLFEKPIERKYIDSKILDIQNISLSCDKLENEIGITHFLPLKVGIKQMIP